MKTEKEEYEDWVSKFNSEIAKEYSDALADAVLPTAMKAWFEANPMKDTIPERGKEVILKNIKTILRYGIKIGAKAAVAQFMKKSNFIDDD